MTNLTPDTLIDILNAALTATANSPITSITDGSAEATVAAANWERIVRAELAYPWSWTRATQQVNRVDGAPLMDWEYAYQVPAEFTDVERVLQNGHNIAWERVGQFLLTDTADDQAAVIAVGRHIPDVRRWPAEFTNAMIMRFEALFLRSIGDGGGGAAVGRDQAADIAFQKARTADARRRSPRNPYMQSELITARRGGGSTEAPWAGTFSSVFG